MIKNKKGIGVGLIVFLVILGIGLLVVGAFALKVISIPVKTVTNQVDSAVDIVDKTYTADNAIYNYEWFKTQYEKIQANRNQIQNANNSLIEFKQTYGNTSSWDYETKQEYNRLNTIKLGLQNQDENLVAEYNARSKMANREIFKDKLPLYVDRILW
jgi:hypothetical protein